MSAANRKIVCLLLFTFSLIPVVALASEHQFFLGYSPFYWNIGNMDMNSNYSETLKTKRNLKEFLPSIGYSYIHPNGLMILSAVEYQSSTNITRLLENENIFLLSHQKTKNIVFNLGVGYKFNYKKHLEFCTAMYLRAGGSKQSGGFNI
jgi:hypothetical protein